VIFQPQTGPGEDPEGSAREGRGGEDVGGQSCFQCGRYLPPGSLKYVVHIRIYADFDGFLSISDDLSDEDMDQIREAMGARSPEDLERDVYQEIGLLL